MNRALQTRLKKLEGARGDLPDELTEEQLQARLEAWVADFGGFDALLASLDDSNPLERRLRELTHWYLEDKHRRSHAPRERNATPGAHATDGTTVA